MNVGMFTMSSSVICSNSHAKCCLRKDLIITSLARSSTKVSSESSSSSFTTSLTSFQPFHCSSLSTFQTSLSRFATLFFPHTLESWSLDLPRQSAAERNSKRKLAQELSPSSIGWSSTSRSTVSWSPSSKIMIRLSVKNLKVFVLPFSRNRRGSSNLYPLLLMARWVPTFSDYISKASDGTSPFT